MIIFSAVDFADGTYYESVCACLPSEAAIAAAITAISSPSSVTSSTAGSATGAATGAGAAAAGAGLLSFSFLPQVREYI